MVIMIVIAIVDLMVVVFPCAVVENVNLKIFVNYEVVEYMVMYIMVVVVLLVKEQHLFLLKLILHGVKKEMIQMMINSLKNSVSIWEQMREK
jgi:hypothetical protein